MQIRKLELEGAGGRVTMERPAGSQTLRIDSIIKEPKGRLAWATWQVETRVTSEEELFTIAERVQERCDGHVGTNSMVHDYYREMQRFMD